MMESNSNSNSNLSFGSFEHPYVGANHEQISLILERNFGSSNKTDIENYENKNSFCNTCVDDLYKCCNACAICESQGLSNIYINICIAFSAIVCVMGLTYFIMFFT